MLCVCVFFHDFRNTATYGVRSIANLFDDEKALLSICIYSHVKKKFL